MFARLRSGLTQALVRVRARDGFSLVEVLVSILLLVTILASVLDAMTMAMFAGKATQARSIVIGLARTRASHLIATAYAHGIDALDDPSEEEEMTGQALTGDPELAVYQIATALDPHPASAYLRRATVTVTCSTCKVRRGETIRPVVITTSVRGRMDDEW